MQQAPACTMEPQVALQSARAPEEAAVCGGGGGGVAPEELGAAAPGLAGPRLQAEGLEPQLLPHLPGVDIMP